MDNVNRNQMIGIALLVVLFLAYYFFSTQYMSSPQSLLPNEQVIQAVGGEKETAISQPTSSPDGVLDAQDDDLFATLRHGKEKVLVVENTHLAVSFSSLGGRIQRVLLKKHRDYQGEPLVLYNETAQRYIKQHFIYEGKEISIDALFFTATLRRNEGDQGATLLTFRGELPTGQTLERQYFLPPDGYLIHYALSVPQEILSTQKIHVVWKEDIMRIEKNKEKMQLRSGVNYHGIETGFDDLVNPDSLVIEETVNWFSIKQLFFSAALIREGGIRQLGIEIIPTTEERIVKRVRLTAVLPTESGRIEYQYYFGPNEPKHLMPIAPDFNKNVYMGWGFLSWINHWMIAPIFAFFESYFSNYGLVIFMMVFSVRLLLSPLTYRSQLGMAKMRILKPALDAIKQKHPEDLKKQQSETMHLYQKMGINPLGGCVPMILQMPILIAMFYFFPNNIKLRQQPFLWADDLSAYDSVLNLPFTIPYYGDHVSLFTLLMTASTLLYTWYNNQITTVARQMRVIQYMVPFLFLFVLNSYSAGLTFYYFVSNIFSIVQQQLMKPLVREEDIKEKLHKKQRQKVDEKKPRLQMRLEKARRGAQKRR